MEALDTGAGAPVVFDSERRVANMLAHIPARLKKTTLAFPGNKSDGASEPPWSISVPTSSPKKCVSIRRVIPWPLFISA